MIRHVPDENSLNGVGGAQKRFFPILAESDRPGNVRNLDQNRTVGVLGKLDAVTQQDGRSFLSTLAPALS
jgi:hypothetical protein